MTTNYTQWKQSIAYNKNSDNKLSMELPNNIGDLERAVFIVTARRRFRDRVVDIVFCGGVKNLSRHHIVL